MSFFVNVLFFINERSDDYKKSTFVEFILILPLLVPVEQYHKKQKDFIGGLITSYVNSFCHLDQ